MTLADNARVFSFYICFLLCYNKVVGGVFMATQKGGCFLINKEMKTVALIFRPKQNDYSFPKGHERRVPEHRHRDP